MLTPVNLDERELLIFNSADEFWATRLLGRSGRDRLGPFSDQLAAEKAVMKYFEDEVIHSTPSVYTLAKPFSIYASSSLYGRSHVCIGNIYRDGVHRPTHKEVSLKRQEERERARKSSRSRNT